MKRSEITRFSIYSNNSKKYMLLGFTSKRVWLKDLQGKKMIISMHWFKNNYHLVKEHRKGCEYTQKKIKEMPVKQYSNFGVYIKTFDSVQAAADTLNIPVANIINCVIGNQRTAYKFVWKLEKYV